MRSTPRVEKVPQHPHEAQTKTMKQQRDLRISQQCSISLVLASHQYCNGTYRGRFNHPSNNYTLTLLNHSLEYSRVQSNFQSRLSLHLSTPRLRLIFGKRFNIDLRLVFGDASGWGRALLPSNRLRRSRWRRHLLLSNEATHPLSHIPVLRVQSTSESGAPNNDS